MEKRQRSTSIHGRQSPLNLNLLHPGSQVSLESNGVNHCGGSLISKYMVIFKKCKREAEKKIIFYGQGGGEG